MRKNLPLIVLASLFLFLRLYHLTDSLNFGTDQGLGMLETYNLYQAKKITLIAQTGVSWTVNGRYIFFGSLPYYIYMPVLIASRWNPLSISILFIFLQLVSVLFLYYVLVRFLKNTKTGNLFFFIFSVMPLMVDHSRFLWSPNLLISLSAVLISFLILIKVVKKRRDLLSLSVGFICGIGFYIHPSFLIPGILSLTYVIYKDRRFKTIMLNLAGFIAGISPLIIFDLRHELYNLKTAFFVLSVSSGQAGSPAYRFNFHYLLPLIPFIIFFVSYVLTRMNRYLVILFLSVFTVYSLAQVLPAPSNGYTMVAGWNWNGENKIKDIVLSENRKGYNIVDLLTGDTRGMAERYLLTVAGNPPLGVTDYPATDYLFVYSKDPIEKILSGKLWEIDSVRPVDIVKSWEIQNGIYLYLLARS